MPSTANMKLVVVFEHELRRAAELVSAVVDIQRDEKRDEKAKQQALFDAMRSALIATYVALAPLASEEGKNAAVLLTSYRQLLSEGVQVEREIVVKK